ncbi:MAG: efflux RND transporter periplasmic adaptor subunit [Deltaproteobacteria bacterium]|nr:efflux RND transporter periplasmic adaptor subunit [Deltaproteobacteria bacterium]
MPMRKSPVLTMAAIMALSVFTACHDKIEPGVSDAPTSPPKSVKIETAATADSTGTIQVVGTVRAREASTLSAKIMGVITSVTVEEASRVRAGEVLVFIDPTAIDASAQKAGAAVAEARQAKNAALSALESARAQFRLAEATFRRFEKLHADHLVSFQEFDQAKASRDNAEAAVNQAKASVDAASQRIGQAVAGQAEVGVSVRDAQVRAPYDGVVTKKYVSAGDLASPGAPLLALESFSGQRADIGVPESLAGSLAVGQRLAVSVSGASADPYTAVIRAILPSADEKSRTVTVQADLPKDPALRSGMFARTDIPVKSARVLTVPESAVVRHGQLEALFVVDGKNAARLRMVRVGATGDGRAEIVSGLSEGTRYVAAPPAGLSDGEKVEAAR